MRVHISCNLNILKVFNIFGLFYLPVGWKGKWSLGGVAMKNRNSTGYTDYDSKVFWHVDTMALESNREVKEECYVQVLIALKIGIEYTYAN